MLFNSLEFIYGFLPVALGLFYLSSKFKLLKLCKVLLLVASLFFYGYWKVSYFGLIILSILVNYAMAVIIEKYRYKSILAVGITFNLGLLGYFKYLTFVINNLKHIFPLTPMAVEVAIPLGISFYTFQQITYLVDVYQRKTKTFTLMEYALFVSFFPQLIAGPIVHYLQIMPQINRTRTYLVKYKNIFLGIFFFMTGLFQKIVIADFLHPIADTGFLNAGLLSFVEAWVVLLAYSLQIYFDFSGYSNMAIGLGLLFNIRLPINFNSPYQATSIIDFWRRWHISLSNFLKDYLYIPLGGNRKGRGRQLSNIMITMLIGGFWHGAGWTFIIWGGYHGMLLVINHSLKNSKFSVQPWIARITTFTLATYGWVFFKSESFSQAMSMTGSLLGANGIRFRDFYFVWKYQVLLCILILGVAMFLPNAQKWSKRLSPTLRWNFAIISLFIINLLFLNRESAFLYFQF